MMVRVTEDFALAHLINDACHGVFLLAPGGSTATRYYARSDNVILVDHVQSEGRRGKP